MSRFLRRFEYVEAGSIEDATELLLESQGGAKLLAGGTDLLVLMRKRRTAPKVLIYIKGIPELEDISYSSKTGLKIGAAVDLASITCSVDVNQKFSVLEHEIPSVIVWNSEMKRV